MVLAVGRGDPGVQPKADVRTGYHLPPRHTFLRDAPERCSPGLREASYGIKRGGPSLR